MSLKTRNALIVEEYQVGYSLMFLADKYYLTLERIRQIVRDSGIERRPPSLHYSAERKAYLCMDCHVEIRPKQKRCPDCAKRAKYRQTAESAKRHGLVEVLPPPSVAHPGTHITPVPEDVLRRFAEWREHSRAQRLLSAGTVTQGQKRVYAAECEDEEYAPTKKRHSRGYAICCPACNRKVTNGIPCRCGRRETK